jgi:hypothetical protein
MPHGLARAADVNRYASLPRSMASIVLWMMIRLTYPFRLAALVWLRQRMRKVATLFDLTVCSLNQLSNVLVFLSHR